MKLQLLRLYDALTESFWFVPLLMAGLAAAAALGSVALDKQLDDGFIDSTGWIWSGSATGARSVLSTIAGSVMTVVSIVFSITVTALAMMSSQFGPRILRNFTADRGNQITLGTFIATFIYCLMVLRTVRSVEESAFAPHLSVTIGVAMAVASLAILIYFIHHVSQSLQVEYLIAEVGHEFQQLLPKIFPEEVGKVREKSLQDEGKADANPCSCEISWEQASVITSSVNGYIQRVDHAKIMRIANKEDLVVQLVRRPGDFVAHEMLLLRAWPPFHVTAKIKQGLAECFVFGSHRTPHQDITYPVQQLVEIALHALSPGINEPFTALNCIDWLSTSLRGVIVRVIPSPCRYNNHGTLRVIARPYRFEEFAVAAFDQIRLYGSNNPEIVLRLLEVIAELAPYLHREDDRQSLIRHTTLIGEDASRIINPSDRQRVESYQQQVILALTVQRIQANSPQRDTEK